MCVKLVVAALFTFSASRGSDVLRATEPRLGDVAATVGGIVAPRCQKRQVTV